MNQCVQNLPAVSPSDEFGANRDSALRVDTWLLFDHSGKSNRLTAPLFIYRISKMLPLPLQCTAHSFLCLFLRLCGCPEHVSGAFLPRPEVPIQFFPVLKDCFCQYQIRCLQLFDVSRIHGYPPFFRPLWEPRCVFRICLLRISFLFSRFPPLTAHLSCATITSK